MSGERWLVRVLTACYPADWRHRYGDEYAQLLCDLRIHRRPALIADSLRGAVRAHGGVLMTTGSPMTVAVWAVGLFTVAGTAFAKLAEDLADRGGSMYALLVAAAGVALLALVAAAAPSAVALLRGHDAGAWKYVPVPFVGAVSWYGVLHPALALSSGHGVHSAPTVAGFSLIMVAGLAVVATTAWAAATVVRRVPGSQPARLRPVALLTVAGGMIVATVAALLWGLQVRSAQPATFHGDQGILATPFALTWIAVVSALGTAAALATVAGRRQLAALD